MREWVASTNRRALTAHVFPESSEVTTRSLPTSLIGRYWTRPEGKNRCRMVDS